MFDFAGEVQSVVGPELNQLGSEFGAVEEVIEGGRLGAVAFYRSDDCKIQIYISSREGEINCMIAPSDAPNEFGLANRSKKWQYLTKFVLRSDMPASELAKSSAPQFDTDRERVEWVRDYYFQNFGAAQSGITQMFGR